MSVALDAASYVAFKAVRSLRLFCILRVLQDRELLVWARLLWLAAIYYMPLIAIPAYLLLGGQLWRRMRVAPQPLVH